MTFWILLTSCVYATSNSHSQPKNISMLGCHMKLSTITLNGLFYCGSTRLWFISPPCHIIISAFLIFCLLVENQNKQGKALTQLIINWIQQQHYCWYQTVYRYIQHTIPIPYNLWSRLIWQLWPPAFRITISYIGQTTKFHSKN